jgi:hypothetical protein
MAVAWDSVVPYVSRAFEAGQAPERGDVIAAAFDSNAPDDIIDALDTLGPRPIPSLDDLKERLAAAGQLA